MKKIVYPLLMLSLAFVFSCTNDDDDSPSLPTTLQYDGENVTGPILPAGEYEAAVRFPSSLLADYVGRNLEGISFFLGDRPAGVIVRIYGDNSVDTPGDLLFEADVTNGVGVPNWNQLPLSDPIEITGDDIWISILFIHDQNQQSIGCDAGPNTFNGDWLFQDSDNEWRTFRDRTGENINWNIRAEVSEE